MYIHTITIYLYPPMIINNVMHVYIYQMNIYFSAVLIIV